jgi:hypothetical protein
VYNVENKVYFEAFTNQERVDIVDFEGASLMGEVFLPPPWFDAASVSSFPSFPRPPQDLNLTLGPVIDGKVKTIHRGKGFFKFTP